MCTQKRFPGGVVTAQRCLPASVLITHTRTHGATDNCLVYAVPAVSRGEEMALWSQVLETPPAASNVNADGSVNYFPSTVQLENTSRCNLRCRMCPQSLGKTLNADLDLADFARILQTIPTPAKTRVVVQGTGEPLMDRHFFTRVRMARDMGFKQVGTTSNGLLLTPRNCDRLYLAGLTHLTISVDSPEARTYEAIRCGGCFATLMRNLKTLCTHSRRAQLSIGLSAVVHPETAPLLAQFVPIANQLQVDLLTTSFDLVFWGVDGLRDGVMQERKVLREDFASYRALLEAASNLRCTLLVVMPVPGVRVPPQICPFSSNYLGVMTDGTVVPCCRARFEPRLFMGNAFKEPLADILNGAAWRAFRRAWLNGTPPPQCARACYPETTPETTH